MTFTPSEVRAYYTARVPSLKITSQREWRGPCPVHSGKDPNFAVNAETGLAQCHSQCGRGWDIVALEMEIAGLDFARAKERVFDLMGRPQVPWEERNVEAIYDYTDAGGKLLYQVVRNFGKEFKQRRPDGVGGWIWGLGNTTRVPFRLQKFAAAEFIAVCEGEKDVLTLERLRDGMLRVFLAQTRPDAMRGVPLFPRRVLIGLQNSVDGILQRPQARRLPFVLLALRRDRAGDRLAHHPTVHSMLLR
jgi:hypothetical protein